MPLEPLKDTAGPLKRVARWFRAVSLTAAGFSSLIGFNVLQNG